MNGFDIVVLVVAGVLAVLGLVQGVIRLLVGVAAVVVAFILASRFHQVLADLWVDDPNYWLRIGAYLAIFFGTLLAGGLVAWLLRAVIKAAMLSWADRLAGAAVGVAAAALIMALLILPVVAYTPGGETVLRTSVLAPYLLVVSDLFHRLAPQDLAERYRDGVDELRRLWSDADEVL
jgi:membrane protein required for colicin V production